MLGKLSCGTNLNDNSDWQHFGQLLWPSSGQIVKKLVQVLSIHRHAHFVCGGSQSFLQACTLVD